MQKLKLLSAIVLPIAMVSAAPPALANPGPTCSDVLDIDVHGEHIVGDYVTGIGHDEMEWPPSGADIGETVASNRGVAVRGGPGPGAHFEDGVAPGASFCTESRSPGLHF